MDANIHHNSREGDLSPRQIGHLKGKYGFDKINNPDISYVNTKNRYRRRLGKQHARVNYSSKNCAIERLELWEDLKEIACNTDCPWMVGRDLNTITNELEKLVGLHVSQAEVEDFVQCVNSCAFNEIKFSGSC
ncbi:hypothetical protein H5410_026715 [Solanum commersonii]|uniref:Uncharacterized protein n=1 Tax=Solanum commersonii TaxID=4109 RepID=A0A9J5YZU5_SOLCO|nr:hypothetical protein H5410_026715 [Solanum commersonii]